jgi:hypothetical protein
MFKNETPIVAAIGVSSLSTILGCGVLCLINQHISIIAFVPSPTNSGSQIHDTIDL